MKLKNNILGIIFSAAAGVLMHFVYDWSGQNKFIGLIAPVNESVWEHLKLLFFPVLVWSAVQLFTVYKNKKCDFIAARTVALFTGFIFTVTAFYTISGITGQPDIAVVNIGIYILSVILVFLVTSAILKNVKNIPAYCCTGAVVLILVTIILFFIFSYDPPNIGLFSVTGSSPAALVLCLKDFAF